MDGDKQVIMDCIVIGGGPAGLNAALVLGRSRRKTILFDDNKPRNAVTSESHGFITRDGIDPQELKWIAQGELDNYPDVTIERQRVARVTKEDGVFHVTSEDGRIHLAKKVILATGFKEVLPEIDAINEFYGTSLFSCPFCDGWELRDQPLAIISGEQSPFHLAKVVSNWTDDLMIFTNGHQNISEEEKAILESHGIKVNEEKIQSLIGEDGKLQEIKLESGEAVLRTGGFVVADWVQATGIGEKLGCKLNERGGIETDDWRRTSVEGLYACGDTMMAGPSQLIMAAAEGTMAAIIINSALIEEKFK